MAPFHLAVLCRFKSKAQITFIHTPRCHASHPLCKCCPQPPSASPWAWVWHSCAEPWLQPGAHSLAAFPVEQQEVGWVLQLLMSVRCCRTRQGSNIAMQQLRKARGAAATALEGGPHASIGNARTHWECKRAKASVLDQHLLMQRGIMQTQVLMSFQNYTANQLLQ